MKIKKMYFNLVTTFLILLVPSIAASNQELQNSSNTVESVLDEQQIAFYEDERTDQSEYGDGITTGKTVIAVVGVMVVAAAIYFIWLLKEVLI